MERIKYFLLILILFSVSTNLLAQDDPVNVPPPPYFELTEKDEQAYLTNVAPELKIALKEIKKYNMEKYAEFLREFHWTSMELSYMYQDEEKEMIEREMQVLEYEILTESLAIKYKKASGSEKETVKKDLKENLSNLFDVKEQRREAEVKMLEEEIKKLKLKIASRKKNKEIIVRRRVEELLGDDEVFEWE